MTDTTHHVMTQTEGSAPEFVAEFANLENAEACLAELGADLNEPLFVPDDETGEVTVAYNLGSEEGCPIGWIEEHSDLPVDDHFPGNRAYG